ncbi:hypothetical protein CLV65_1203 [Pseudoscardovia suis]|uniref:Uncharacterized protein n=1 Tax=Pseudoscardovia suis TaxID=987063 RepID=A0A261EWB8_9BIFI|nr:hypothetical protein PSSU_1097 [Pseudoscardovia suis]PJJ65952.1 hypothetical protein CLV65_1203 [Pseudoscardovia suis]
MNPAAILMQDEEITALADSLIEIHTSVVSTRGLSLGDSVSQEKMSRRCGGGGVVQRLVSSDFGDSEGICTR